MSEIFLCVLIFLCVFCEQESFGGFPGVELFFVNEFFSSVRKRF